MNHLKKWIALVIFSCSIVALTGCQQDILSQTVVSQNSTGSSNSSNHSSSALNEDSEIPEEFISSSPTSSTIISSEIESTTDTETQTATLYLVLNGNEREYPFYYTGELTPDRLIDGIAELTGWDLSRSEPVTQGKGGMTVCFTTSSALFVGPPDPQKEEFFVFEPGSLTAGILDSIQQTLQKNFIDPSLGDPSNLDIYYCLEGDQPLVLPDIGFHQPIDQPYTGFSVQDSFS